MSNKYWGVYDYKESDTFRPTQEERIHKDHPYGKTMTCRSDSCCVIEKSSGGGKIDTMEQTPDLRIRKLTPKECFRLMGLKDADIEKIMKHQTNASAYHLAGDSIVTTCLMAILGQMVGVNWQQKYKPEEWWNDEIH